MLLLWKGLLPLKAFEPRACIVPLLFCCVSGGLLCCCKHSHQWVCARTTLAAAQWAIKTSWRQSQNAGRVREGRA